MSKKLTQRQICSKLAIEQCLARRVLCICNVILQHPLFDGIPREETHKLSAISDLIRLERKQNLCMKGSPIDCIYFVIRGRLKLFKEDDDSTKVFVSQILNQGDAFGLESLFSETKVFAYTAQALEDSSVLVLDRNKLQKIIIANSVLMHNLLGFLSSRIIDLEERLEDQVLMDIDDRLNKLIEENGSLDEIKLSKTDLAGFLGTVSATLSRVLSKNKSLSERGFCNSK